MKNLCFVLLCMVSFVPLAAGAQNRPSENRHEQQKNNAQSDAQRPAMQFSPEEFRSRQQKFLTEKSGLTEEEAEKFFPVFFELQQKKNDINFNSRENVNAQRSTGPLTDEECTALIDKLADAKLKTAKLEKEYLERFKKIVPASKLLRIQIAETQFGSELIKEMQRAAIPDNSRFMHWPGNTTNTTPPFWPWGSWGQQPINNNPWQRNGNRKGQ